MPDALQPLSPGRPCSYCGQELRADYYFCPACSKPWRSGEPGLGPAPEPVWDNETRIRKRAPEAYHLFFCYLAAVLLAAVISLMLSGGPHAEMNMLVLMSIAMAAVALWAGLKYRDIEKKGGDEDGFARSQRSQEESLHEASEADFLGYRRHETPQEERGWQREMRAVEIHLVLCAVTQFMLEPVLQGVAAAHLSVLSFPYLLLVGILLGWLFQKTGSVYPGIVIHAAHNFAVILHAVS